MAELMFKQGNIHYTDQGKGTAVVLLHGFLEDQTMWNKVAQKLLSKYRVITIDLPGHGQSDCFGYVHTMELMAEAVQQVLQTLKLRKVHVVGHSMGGYTALALAEKWPDHIRSLCLMFSTARADNTDKKKNRDRAIKLVQQNHKSFIRSSIPLLFRPKHRKLLRNEINVLKERALGMSQRGVIAALEGMKRRKDREVLLHFAPYPVHYIIGEKDPVLDQTALLEQVESSPNSSATVIRGIGHMGHLEDFEWTMEGIYDSIERAR